MSRENRLGSMIRKAETDLGSGMPILLVLADRFDVEDVYQDLILPIAHGLEKTPVSMEIVWDEALHATSNFRREVGEAILQDHFVVFFDLDPSQHTEDELTTFMDNLRQYDAGVAIVTHLSLDDIEFSRTLVGRVCIVDLEDLN